MKVTAMIGATKDEIAGIIKNWNNIHKCSWKIVEVSEGPFYNIYTLETVVVSHNDDDDPPLKKRRKTV